MLHKKLKLEEALIFLREGKPIRCILWPRDTYIYINKNGEVCINSNNPTIEINLLADYEIYTSPILDDSEKQYLENYLSPFKDRVECIYKTGDIDFNPLLGDWYFPTYERLNIIVKSLNQKTGKEKITLPLFVKGSMYRKMKLGRQYTIEDLEL